MMNENKFKFLIDEEHAGDRIDSVLSSLLEDCSRSYIVKLIENGHVFVDEKVLNSKKEKLKVGSSVIIELPQVKSCEAEPEDIPVEIVYEDDDIVVVNKAKGMVVHPAAGNLTGTLVNGLLYHCKTLSNINGVERPGIVHRIDKDTSGLLVVAKTDIAHRNLSEQFADHSINRIYTGICFYRLDEDFTVDAPIGRDPNNRLRMAVVPDGKHAVTHIHILNNYKGFTEFQAKLETGRTHQIRVHMAYKHHPLLGDVVYGPKNQPYKTVGQMLHAGTLGFIHPTKGEYIEFKVNPPEEYIKIKERLNND